MLLPGNVMFDPSTAQLVIIPDHAQTMCPTTTLIPYITHPTTYNEAAVPTKLKQVPARHPAQ